MTSKAKVFLSYARADAKRVQELSAQLEAMGLEFWHDKLIQPGQEWSRAVHYAISTSTVFLLFISKSFQESTSLSSELGAILSVKKLRSNTLIIPILLMPITLDEVPKDLRRYQFLELGEDNQHEVIDAIVAAVETASVSNETPTAETPKLEWRRSNAEHNIVETPKLEWRRSDAELEQRARYRRVQIASAISLVLVGMLALLAFQSIQQLNTAQDALRRAYEAKEISEQLKNAPDVDLSGADLHQSRLDGIKIVRARLDRANLNYTSLRRANLRGTTLTFASLRSADLSGADLRNANLEGADLTEALLSETILSDANLRGSILRGVDLRNAKGLTIQQLQLACGDEATQLPAEMKVPSCGPVASPVEKPGNS